MAARASTSPQKKARIAPEQKAIPRFCELIRVSSKGQSDRGTPQAQRAALDRLRVSRPGTFVERIEVEGGISGATKLDDRPDLQRLFELLATREVDEVRVWAIDRLTRTSDGVERAMIFGAVKDAGARIVTCDGAEYDAGAEGERGFTSELMLNIQGLFAAREKANIKARMKEGKRRVANEGCWSGEHLRYGVEWDSAAKRFVADATKADTVRRIFEECAAGRTLKQIAEGLTGIESPRGKKNWNRATVRGVLHRESYVTGELAVTIAGGEQIPYADPLPPIITRELWTRVQAQLAVRGTRPAGRPWSTLKALLRGLAFCGRCGRPIHVSSGGAGEGYIRYRCSSAHSSSPGPHCGANWHDVKSTDAKVWEQLSRTLSDRTLLAQAVALTPSKNGTFEAEAVAASCKEQLRALAQHEKQTMFNHRRGRISHAAYDRELREIESDRTMRARRLKDAEDELAQAALASDASDALLNLMREEQDRVLALIKTVDATSAAGMRRALLQTYDFDQQRRLVELLVPRGVDDCGFTLHDNGQHEIKGVLERPEQARGAGKVASWSR